MSHFRPCALVAALLAVVLLVTGCSGGDVPPKQGADRARASTSPDPALPVVTMSEGTGGEITVEELSDPVPPIDIVTARSALVEVVVETQPAEGVGAQVRWPIPADWEEHWAPVVVWEDGAGGWRWLPTRMETGPDGEVAVATTDHFSRGFLASFDPNGVAQDLADDALGLFTGRAGADAPVCERSDEVSDLVEVVSDAVDGVEDGALGDAVLWCAGVQDGEPVLKITNNRRILAQVLIPANATVMEQERGFSLSKGIAGLGAGIESFAQGLPQDREVLLLEKGATITVQVPTDERSGVEVSASGVGYLLSTLILGLDTYTTVIGAAGLEAAADSNALLRLLGTGAGSDEDWALTTVDCFRAFGNAYGNDVTAPVDLDAVMGSTFTFLLECGMSIGAASIDDSGPLGWIVSATVKAVAALLSLVVTALELLIAAVAEGISAVWGDEDAIYTVITTPVERPGGSVPGHALLEGAWSGPVDQPGSGPYGLRVLFSGSGASLGAQVDYPELGCSGSWEISEVKDGRYLFVETITSGSRCVDVLTVSVEAVGGELHVEGQPPYYFTAVLTPDTGEEGQDPSAGTGWPVGSNDAPGGLYAWLGAASAAGRVSIGFPDWVSCTSTSDLCIASDGDTVAVIERGLSGFSEAHVLSASSPARSSLLALGYDEDLVDELLSP